MKLFSTLHTPSLKYFLVFLGLSFLLFPIVTYAGDDILGEFSSTIMNTVGGAVSGEVAKGIAGFIIGGLQAISVTLLNYGLSFLNWTASGDFIQGGMGSSISNPIIEAGWGAMRNLANILLIFGLVAIAISIMVGYEENKAKKMLIRFVITALLINFTPVLCGVVIDLANIIMASFLKGGVSSALITALENAKTVDSINSLGIVFIFTLISFVTFFIYILYGLLFMVRYIWLWLLIVLSPIALATRAFPDNEYLSYMLPDLCQWKEWKRNFLQWAFIGVPAAFSIYLSETMMAAVIANPTLVTSAPSGELSGVFSKVFSYIIPLAVLVMGFVMTVSKGGYAGKKIEGLAGGLWNRSGAKVGSFVRDQTTGRLDKLGRGAAEGYSRGAATTRSDAAARGEKASLTRQLTGGLRQAGRGAAESQYTTGGQKLNADKAIATETRKSYVTEMTNWTDGQKDAVLSSGSNSIKALAQKDAIIKERADKGKLKDAEINVILSNPEKYEKDTREAVMKRMPHLVPALSDQKDRKMSTNANPILRQQEQEQLDNIMIKDFMNGKMTAQDKHKIQVDSALNYGSVSSNLEAKHIKSIFNSANTDKLKKLKENQLKLEVAYDIKRTGTIPPNSMGIASVAQARVFIDNEEQKTKLLSDRLIKLQSIKTSISRTNPNYKNDSIFKSADEEQKRLRDVINERERLIKGIIL
ncbi:hypothetical protein M0R01_00280 [bacterium]|nr:hypothetical protein [bacterium]